MLVTDFDGTAELSRANLIHLDEVAFKPPELRLALKLRYFPMYAAMRRMPLRPQGEGSRELIRTSLSSILYMRARVMHREGTPILLRTLAEKRKLAPRDRRLGEARRHIARKRCKV